MCNMGTVKGAGIGMSNNPQCSVMPIGNRNDLVSFAHLIGLNKTEMRRALPSLVLRAWAFLWSHQSLGGLLSLGDVETRIETIDRHLKDVNPEPPNKPSILSATKWIIYRQSCSVIELPRNLHYVPT